MNIKDPIKSLFEDLIGQPTASSLLEAALQQNKIAPAYLFTGPEGVGRKLATIRFLEGLTSKEYSSEKQRRRIENLNHPDLIWIEPTYLHQGRLISKSVANKENINQRNHPQIRLEQIRGVTRFLGKQPIEAEISMVVIEDVERMNEAAANALLKTLEEPGNGLLILLTATPERLLSTIRSRCQTIPFRRLNTSNLQKVINQITISKDLALYSGFNQEILIKLSNGSPGALIDNIETWERIPNELWPRLKELPNKPIEALSLARDITESVSGEQQLWLIDWLQHHHWDQRKNAKLIKRFDILRSHLMAFVQPRLAWEVALLEVRNTTI